MAEDYSSDGMYDDAPDAPAASSDSAPKEETADKSQTALLPKSIFQGKDLKPGSRCTFEVVAVLEEEVQVDYVSHKGESDKPRKTSGMEEMLD